MPRDAAQVELILAAAVDEAIEEMLGEGVLEAFYVHLNESGISRKDLPNKVKLFSTVLETTFGIQSTTIQRNVAKKLFNRLNLEFQSLEDDSKDSKSLPDFIKDAKKAIMMEA